MNAKILLAFMLVCISQSLASENAAKLIVSKAILNTYLVERKEITLQYNIYNIGSSAATDIELKDENFPPEYFEVVMGTLSSNWPYLAPGGNLTHSVIVTPNSAGFFNFTSAYVSYKANEEDKTTTFGYSTIPGELPIYNIREFNRMTEWISFCFICIPSIVIPFVLWYSSHRKYTSMPSHKKSK